MLKYIGLQQELSEDFFYCAGFLLINAGLPADRVLEIIKEYLSDV